MEDLLKLALDGAITLIGAAVLVMGRPLVARAADWLQLRADSEVRAYLMEGLDRAVEYGRAEARRRLLEAGGRLVPEQVPELEMSLAREYAADRFPDALKRFGMQRADVQRVIRARMSAPPAVSTH